MRRQPPPSAMAPATSKGVAELFVLSGRGAPELQELTNLPAGVHLLDTGRPDEELKRTGGYITSLHFTLSHGLGMHMLMCRSVSMTVHALMQIGQRQSGKKWKSF